MNKSAYSIVVFLLVGVFLGSYAGAADLKVGFIDAERINRESLPAERATKKTGEGVRSARTRSSKVRATDKGVAGPA